MTFLLYYRSASINHGKNSLIEKSLYSLIHQVVHGGNVILTLKHLLFSMQRSRQFSKHGLPLPRKKVFALHFAL